MIKLNCITRATEMEQQEASWMKDALEFIENLLFDATETMEAPLPECLRTQLSSLYADLRNDGIDTHFKKEYRLFQKAKIKGVQVQHGVLLFSPKTSEARTLLGLQEVILYRFGYIKAENLRYTDPEKGFRYVDPND